ncbi:helix-turn-helix domain-containing protein [Maridesulfovibrio sp.]|uniref:helix-turn-helix domain-containing protein n=1 Tax=Maridesulfovibrio sp. TaxID=2795000 RepID=UPI002AA943E1|nr:helix-turn-helix domain-containing protein [Maridesulfovibrio sp.]
MDTEHYITEQQVAKITALSLSKLRSDRHLCKGIPYHKIERTVRYRVNDIEKFMAEHRIEPVARS